MNVAELIATLGFKVDNSSKTSMEKTITSMNSSMSTLESTASKISTLLNVGIAAGVVSSIAKPIVNLVKETTGLYGEFEQLKGGISTLFGTNEMSLEEYAESAGSSIADIKEEYEGLEKTEQLVMENASKAYHTAQMSQSEYMSTVTNFAAALKSSTGSAEEAAKAADTAIIAMADNWNKMGSNPEMVKNAYMGLARGNYMMIDNLKLGYAGTKKEMERMVKDASEKSGKNLEMGNLADMFEAIKIIQDELKISGTTEREAEKTLQGSSAMLKASWTNLKTAIGSGEGFDTALEAVFSSAEAVIDNYTPVIERSISGVVQMFSKVIPTAVKKILEPNEDTGKNLIQTIVPTFTNALFEAATELIQAFPSVAKSMYDGFMDAIEDTWDAFTGEDNPISKLLSSFGVSGEDITTGIQNALNGLVKWADANVKPLAKDILGLFDGIDVAGILKGVGTVVVWLFNIIKPGIELVLAILRSIITVLNGAVMVIKHMFRESSGFSKIWKGIGAIFNDVGERAGRVFNKFKDGLEKVQPVFEFIGQCLGVVVDLILVIGEFLVGGIATAIDWFLVKLEWLADAFGTVADGFSKAYNFFTGKDIGGSSNKSNASGSIPITSTGNYSGSAWDFGSIKDYFDTANNDSDESVDLLTSIDGNMELLRRSQYTSPEALSTSQTTNTTTSTTINQSNSFTNNFTGTTNEVVEKVNSVMKNASRDVSKGLKNNLSVSN